MKILLSGIVAMIIGVIGVIGWWSDFLRILKWMIPIILVLGGALALYLGIEDIKTRRREATGIPPASSAAAAGVRAASATVPN